ncbi:MFS transporter [Sunxiuqinia sp. A32]|uniref:MFS transporter n=1 Tax=Sunxiuqinia sp. A32 TaxID=3461496 RepID=UPI0040454109
MKTNKITVVVALASVFFMAGCFVVPGASSLALMEKLNLDKSDWGTVVGVFLYSAMVVQFFIGAITDKIGHKPTALVGFAFAGISWTLIAIAPSYVMLIAGAIMMGIGAMCLNTVGNTIIPQVLFEGKDPSRASSLGNAFFGLGLFSVPLLINYSSSYSVGLMIMTGVSLLMLIPVFLSDFPKANLNYKFSVGFRLLGQLPVLIAAFAMMCSIGLDNAFKQWIPQVLTSMGTPAKEASLSISVFGLSMMSGRFIFSTVKNMTGWSAKILIVASACFAVVFYTLTIFNSSTAAYILSAMAGLAAAPMFPSIVGMTFSKYDRKYYGSIFGMIFSIGLFFAGMLMQIIGNISNKSTIQAGLKVPILVAIALIIITIIMNKSKAKEIVE